MSVFEQLNRNFQDELSMAILHSELVKMDGDQLIKAYGECLEDAVECGDVSQKDADSRLKTFKKQVKKVQRH